MRPEVQNQLTHLDKMSKSQLFALWRQLFKASPSTGLRKNLLIKLLAYRIQEQTHGGLSPAARKRLSELARKLEGNPKAELSNTPRIKPGTRLMREWSGQTHSVTVLESGYEYAGKRYASLSEVARLITGTRWSGPLFFGLRNGNTRDRKDG